MKGGSLCDLSCSSLQNGIMQVKGLPELPQRTEGDWPLSVVPTPGQVTRDLWTSWSQVGQVSQECKYTNKQQTLPRSELRPSLKKGRLKWKWIRGAQNNAEMKPKSWTGGQNSEGHSKSLYFLPTFPHYLPVSLLSFLGVMELWNPQTCTPLGDKHYRQ